MNVDPLKLTPPEPQPLTDVQFAARLAGAASQLASMCLGPGTPEWVRTGAHAVFDALFGETVSVDHPVGTASEPEPAAAPEETLRWPPASPPTPELPAIYAENYYVTRCDVSAPLDTNNTDASAREPNRLHLITGCQLQYVRSVWQAHPGQWHMVMQVTSGEHAGKCVGVWAADVKPTDEEVAASDKPVAAAEVIPAHWSDAAEEEHE